MVSETAQEVADAVATWIAAQSRRAYGDHGSFSIALSGGSTPRMLNELLAGPEWHGRIDWSWWNVYFADERACPGHRPETSSTFGSEICVPGRKSLKSSSGLYCCNNQIGTFTLRCVMFQSESPRRAT